MAKFVSTLFLVAVIITVQGLPPTYDEILAASRNNQWDQVQKLFHENFAKTAEFKPTVFEDVRNLKPVDGGHVYGEAEYLFHSASNIDGKTTEDHTGHKLVNDDGKIKEFNFTPKADQSNFNIPIISQPQNGNDYSASDYSFNYAPASADQPADYTGSNNVKIGQPPIVPFPHQSLNSPPNQAAPGPNSYNQQYSYSHSHSYVNGKPVHDSFGNNAGNFHPGSVAPLVFTDVRDLKPPQGGQVFGEAQFQYHTSSNINGKVSEDQGGHKIINNNGQVQEYDFPPSPNKSPIKTYIN